MVLQRQPKLPAADNDAERALPSGVTLHQTLSVRGDIKCLAFDPSGGLLASGDYLWDVSSGQLIRKLNRYQNRTWSVSFDPQGELVATCNANKVDLWTTRSGKLIFTFKGQSDGNVVISTAFDPTGKILASAGFDRTIKLSDARNGKLLYTLEGHTKFVWSVRFHPTGEMLASASGDQTVKLWDTKSGRLLHTLVGHAEDVASLAFHPHGKLLASGSFDKTVKLWDLQSGKLLRSLEGYTESIYSIVFSPDGHLLASKSGDSTIRLWRTDNWAVCAQIPAATWSNSFSPGLAFHPTQTLLATGVISGTAVENHQIHIWKLNYSTLLDGAAGTALTPHVVHHTTGKIVLVGDHSVGKSALGHRMIHGEFKEQASTHGLRFWVFPDLSKERKDGTECEAILWDLAGQPDYRLIHALFVDDADLALVLFDAADIRDPLRGVEFWLKQLRNADRCCPIILVAAQTDRGSCSLTADELAAFCQDQGIAGPIHTSALEGKGVAELIKEMKSLLPWEDKPATVTTTTFKRIKDYVIGLKDAGDEHLAIVTSDELRVRLEATDPDWQFTDTEMTTVVGHLENYGYTKRLRTSKGDLRILLEPERLNNLASSFVLEARRNPRGLGALEENRLLEGDYKFQELSDLDESERDVLLDSAALLFLEKNVCFREIDPLNTEPYLVFPELINLKKPIDDDKATEESAAYTVHGPTENVFASLVVLLGYTHLFTRTSQWQQNARYEVGEGLICGFREEAERDGELDFVLCFAPKVGAPIRTLFQGMFESFLARRNLTVMRYEPVCCSNGHPVDRATIRRRLNENKTNTFCEECGIAVELPTMTEPIQLSRDDEAKVATQHRAADRRTLFEQAVFRVQAYVDSREDIQPLDCFISYAWGEPEHEHWAEKRLALDLQKAGISVILDRWENSRVGFSISRFVERIEKADRVITIGTPLYRMKYENKDTKTGYVVAGEIQLINDRLLGTEEQKRSILPLVLAGEKQDALPPLLHDKVYADFRNEESYFTTAFDLILDLYDIPHTDQAVADLRDQLRGRP